jgi:hypothetical protein
MTNIDTNVDNYTIDELNSVLELDNPTEQEITDASNKYIDKYTQEGDETMTTFFQDVQNKLLQYMDSLDNGDDPGEYNPDNTQTQDWIDDEALQQDDPTQSNKNTDRSQKIDVYDNQHLPMKKEQVGITNTVDTKVAQDALNPNLTNVTNRTIVLDSQFRQTDVSPNSTSTDYTLDLSETLNNVISLRLYSIQIPVCWYVIDIFKGNTCFWVTNYVTDTSNTFNTFTIEIASGNYTATELVDALNNAFAAIPTDKDENGDPLYVQGFISPIIGDVPVSYNSNTGKLTINLENYMDPNNDVIIGLDSGETSVENVTPFFTFFDKNRQLNCAQKCTPSAHVDSTLGWVMGYRSPITYISSSGNAGSATVNLFGPAYLILVLDDYNQNHVNNGIVNISELSKKLSIPNYYRPDLPYTCINTSTKNIPSLLPSAPRTLTQAQMYTANEIIKTREQDTNYRSKPPSSSDALAIIPLKVSKMTFGETYVEFGGTLQDHKRTYFGPVNIERFRVKLLDDKGNVVNLNGGDWSFTLISDNLYQY